MVKELTITTGVGFSFIMTLSASIPVMRGISMSIVTTSGFNRRTCSTPSCPSLACPTTSKRPSFCIMRDKMLRMKEESSTIKTLILADNFHPLIKEACLGYRQYHPVQDCCQVTVDLPAALPRLPVSCAYHHQQICFEDQTQQPYATPVFPPHARF